MFELNGYTVTEQIYEGQKTNVYRGYRDQDQQPVILKSLNPYASLKQVAQLQREYEITKNLDLTGLVKPYELQNYQERWVLIFEDDQGESLKNLLLKQSIDLEQFLSIAIQLSEHLGELHHHRIIHKDIKPANIIVNLARKLVKITDLSISSRFIKENQTTTAPNLLEGTLAYLSPEQTGRMNRMLDYRTDFYSLGIVFYEMLIGHPPFQSTDPMELVHCHLAKHPTPPHLIKPEIPKVISHLIMKLLAKTAEARYQSAYGFKADLQACLDQLQQHHKIENFQCGQQDVLGLFQIPQKLYGREAQLEQLLQTFKQVSHGRTEMLLITGYSGIGKTALVKEIYKPLTQKRGYFINGKFDQLKRHNPYSAIITAFSDLVQQLLTEDETQLKQWQAQLSLALGSSGQVMIDMIPDIERIIGTQPTLPHLGAIELQNRFNLVFQNFIRVFCQPEHPLVLFLDDLQWIDSATLKLIELIMRDPQIQHLFLIGAYRNNEVDGSHPLLITLDKLREQGHVIQEIVLQSLNFEQICELIAETLQHEIKTIEPLATLVMQKTQGNPFFVNQFLKRLYDNEQILFVLPQSGEIQRGWHWDLAQIKAEEMTDNVVELMVSQLQKLPLVTQQVLQLAACIGHSFDLELLSLIYQKSTSETYQALLPAIDEGLMLSMTPSLEANDAKWVDSSFFFQGKFLHDRVQQAAYSLIDQTEKKRLHFEIGQRLLTTLSAEAQSEKIFEIVDHLQIGIEQVTFLDEKYQIAQLNLQAGQKAKAAIAYELATRFLNQGLELLAQDSWDTQYDLTLNLYVEAIEAEYLNTDFSRAKALADIALSQAKTCLEQIKIYEILIQSFMAEGQMKTALETALCALDKLGVDLLAQAPPENLNIEAYYQLPPMTDSNQLAALRILCFSVSPAYTVNPALYPQIAMTMLNLCVQYGNSSFASYSYSSYGLLQAVQGQIELSYQLGQLALHLLDQFAAKEFKAKVLTSCNVVIIHWKKPVREALNSLLEAIQSGLETGDMEYAGIAAMHYCSYSFFSGELLESLLQKQSKYIELMLKLKQQYQTIYLQIWQQVVLNLQDKRLAPCRLVGDAFNEEETLPQLLKTNYGMAIFAVYVAKSMLCYLFHEIAQSIDYAQKAAPYEQANGGVMVIPIYKFYYSLALLAQYPHTHRHEKKEILATVTRHQEQMKLWAQHAPMNYQHKYDLVEAEKARVLDQNWAAAEYYEHAIQGAKKQRFLSEEALAYELAARFYQSRQHNEFFQLYLTKAYYHYQQWGAKYKADQLLEKHPQLLKDSWYQLIEFGTSITTASTIALEETTHTLASTMSLSAENTLDINSIMKASQAISSEILLDKLIKKFMHIVIENIGAQAGWLILKKPFNSQEEWFIEAHGTADEVELLESVALNAIKTHESAKIAHSILTYVMRTETPIVLNDASQNELFANDPYILQQKPLSVLCSPIVYKNQLIGLFYLENNLIRSAFTSDRLNVLKLLSTQIAISLENAQTMATLDTKVVERTAELKAKVEELTKTRHELIQSEKMASLGRLVAGFAHEINTPIGVAVGAGSSLQETVQTIQKLLNQEEVDEEELLSSLDTLGEAAELSLSNLKRAAGLVSSFKRTAIDQTSEESRNFHVKSIIEDVMCTLHNQFKNTKINIQVDCPKELTIYSLPGTLEQILTNLIMNSLLHGFDRGQPAGQILLTVDLKEKRLHLNYSDTGKGMDRETQEKIFEPFFTTARAQGGSGLGLYICYNLVTTQLHGTIHCESQPGQGVSFHIEYPV